MAMTHKALLERLLILRNVVESKPQYRSLLTFVTHAKLQDGSILTICTDNGIAQTRLRFEQRKVELNKEKNPTQSWLEMDYFQVLSQLTLDYTLISGMSFVEWAELCDYLVGTYYRALCPQLYYRDAMKTFTTTDEAYKQHQTNRALMFELVRLESWFALIVLLELLQSHSELAILEKGYGE